MATKFHNLLISDIVPRNYVQHKYREASLTHHRLNYDWPLNIVLSPAPPVQRSRRVLFQWSLMKYTGGLIVAVAILLFAISGRGNGSTPVTAYAVSPIYNEPEQVMVNYGLPARLRIPKINVNSSTTHLGLTPKAEMATPAEPALAGWFKLGPRPGEIGSSVITGHYGYKDRISSVFDNLHKLQKGDKVYVEDEKGTTTTFVVRETRSYDKDANTSDVFGSSDGKAHLNLITCQGTWNEKQKSYNTRLVVFTDKAI